MAWATSLAARGDGDLFIFLTRVEVNRLCDTSGGERFASPEAVAYAWAYHEEGMALPRKGRLGTMAREFNDGGARSPGGGHRGLFGGQT